MRERQHTLNEIIITYLVRLINVLALGSIHRTKNWSQEGAVLTKTELVSTTENETNTNIVANISTVSNENAANITLDNIDTEICTSIYLTKLINIHMHMWMSNIRKTPKKYLKII